MLSRKCHAITMRAACIMAYLFCSLWASAQGAGYWHTSGAQILDANGTAVRIAGINWYGFETTDMVAHGLYTQDYKTILQTIKNNGYNTIRIPFSSEMVESPVVPGSIQYYNSAGPINTDLQGLNSLQILDAVIAHAGQMGLRVILDNHRSEAGNSAEASGLWYTDAYPESAWISDWVSLATRYKGNTTVIGMDVRNEPHNANSGGSCWSCGDVARDWHLAATKAGNAILAVNPSLLIFVEGTDAIGSDTYFWGGQLAGVASAPVTLSVPNQLVYSPHDYGPKEFQQSWFNGATYTSLVEVWRVHWGYIAQQQIAPVWVGEFGTPNANSDAQDSTPGSQGQWFSSLLQYLTINPSISWAYWALNGEDSYSLLNNVYDATPVNALKQQMLASIEFSLAGSTPITAPTLTLTGTPSVVTAALSSNDTGDAQTVTQMTYSAAIANGTASAISGASLAVSLPASASVLSSATTGTYGSCGSSAATYTCIFSSIPSGGTGTLRLTVVFPQSSLNFGSANSLPLAAAATAQFSAGPSLAASVRTTVNQRPVGSVTEAIQAAASPGTTFPYGTAAVVNFSLSPAPATIVPGAAFAAAIDGGAPVTVSSIATNAWQVQLGNLTGGMHTITINMSANSGYAAASTSLAIVVSATNPTLNPTGPFSATYGSRGSVLIGVTGLYGGVAPTGVLTLSIDNTAPVSATLVNGQARFLVPANTSAGTHSLQFAYDGDANYSRGARAVTYLVAPAQLIAVGNSVSRSYGVANPTLSGVLTGVLLSDGITATYTSQANATTAPGTYTAGVNAVTPALTDPNGRLGNYSVTLTPGIFTILPTANSISFPPIGGQTYGVAPLTLIATSTSGQAVTFGLISGPASLSGNKLTITGAGTITVSAKQDASGAYAAAVSSQSFVVAPASLTVTAQNAARLTDVQNPAFTSTVTGLRNGDTVASLLIAYITSAVVDSPAGSYSITPRAANAANYSVTAVPGTLTITDPPASITWSTPATIVYGISLSVNQLNANASRGLVLTYSPPAGTILNAGTQVLRVSGTSATVTAPISAQVNIVVQQASTITILRPPATATSPFTMVASVASAVQGRVTGGVKFFDSGGLIGTAQLEASGVATLVIPVLTPVVHSYTATYIGDQNNLSSTSVASVVGATTPGDFKLTALPTVLTINPGTSSVVTLSASPMDGIRGPLSLACTNLPANATCTFSPATVTFDGSTNSQTTKITIGLASTTAGNRTGTRSTLIYAALLPWLLFGSFRFRYNPRLRIPLLLFVGALLLSGASGCGGLTNSSGADATSYSAIITARAGTVIHSTTIPIGLKH